MRYLSVLCSISLSVERVETPHVIFYTENQIILYCQYFAVAVAVVPLTSGSLTDSFCENLLKDIMS